MTEIGKLTDTKRTEVRVVVENDAICIYAESPDPNYREPHPHMSASLAVEMCALLHKARAHLAGGPVTSLSDGVGIGRTERGFKDFGENIVDLNGNDVCVRESSAVGAPCVWLFWSDPEPGQARYEAHRAIWESWDEEKRESMLPTWITMDYSCEYEDWGKYPKDYSECPEEKEKAIKSWLHQDWRWLGETEHDFPCVTPKLDADMVGEVIRRLSTFIKDAGAPDNWRNTPEYRAVWGPETEEGDSPTEAT